MIIITCDLVINKARSTQGQRNLRTQLYFSAYSTLTLYDNGAFWKRSSNRTNLKTRALLCSFDRKHYENKAFRKRWRKDNHVISLVSLKHSSKMAVIVALWTFSCVVWTENFCRVFRMKAPLWYFFGVVCGQELNLRKLGTFYPSFHCVALI